MQIPGRAIKSAWSVQHDPGANVQATASQATPGVGFRLVITHIQIVFSAGGTAPTATNQQASVDDGAGTNIKVSHRLGLPATAGATNGITINDCWLEMPLNTAARLFFAAAGGLNTFESISMSGVVVEG